MARKPSGYQLQRAVKNRRVIQRFWGYRETTRRFVFLLLDVLLILGILFYAGYTAVQYVLLVDEAARANRDVVELIRDGDKLYNLAKAFEMPYVQVCEQDERPNMTAQQISAVRYYYSMASRQLTCEHLYEPAAVAQEETNRLYLALWLIPVVVLCPLLLWFVLKPENRVPLEDYVLATNGMAQWAVVNDVIYYLRANRVVTPGEAAVMITREAAEGAAVLRLESIRRITQLGGFVRLLCRAREPLEQGRVYRRLRLYIHVDDPNYPDVQRHFPQERRALPSSVPPEADGDEAQRDEIRQTVESAQNDPMTADVFHDTLSREDTAVIRDNNPAVKPAIKRWADSEEPTIDLDEMRL